MVIIKFTVLWFDFTLIEQKWCLYIRMVKKKPKQHSNTHTMVEIPALLDYMYIKQFKKSISH